MPSKPSPHVTNHLANERTFLAWLRTAIALLGFGVVIVRLRYMTPVAPPPRAPLHLSQLGLVFAAVGLLMVAYSLWHYLAARRAIDAEEYYPAGSGIVFFAAIILLLGVIVVVYLLGSLDAAQTTPAKVSRAIPSRTC